MAKPRKFNNLKEMETLIDQYFDDCDKKGIAYTCTGLAMALNTTRDLLLDYERREKEPEFAELVKKAKMRCHNYAERTLFTMKNPAGAIFNLKNNYGWKDKQEQEISGPGGGAIVIKLEGKLEEWSK